MTQKFESIFIEAISACVPKNKIKRDHFENLLGEKELNRFEKTTGIIERRYVDESVTASELGFHAAKKIIEEEKCKNEIKGLIFLSQTSDYKIPFTSNILQERLKLPKEILCLDINGGCAGFIQGLSVAYSLINSIDDKVMLIVSETLSKILSPHDRGTSLLFGDGASAILISKDENFKGKTYFNFFSDGGNYDAIIIPEGGYKKPFNSFSLDWCEDLKGNRKQGTHLTMDGPRVFDFTLREVPKGIEELINKFDLNLDDIDAFLFHQSNKFIIKQISSRLKIPKDKVPMNIHKFGNTSGVSIPLLIISELEKDKVYNNLLMSGYGSGLNWGNCLMTLSPKLRRYNLIEL